jgi:hypothetical protein
MGLYNPVYNRELKNCPRWAVNLLLAILTKRGVYCK